MRSPRLRFATFAFLIILTMDLVDGPPPGSDGHGYPANGRASVQADGFVAPDAEFFCGRSTVADPFLLPARDVSPEALVPRNPVRTRLGFVSRPFRPPRSSR
jgi:hypothetical protein